MAEVDPRIAAPRRATPRTAVPQGSVAIAGGQTGVYPTVTPGGWNIIGRTPLRPYDPDRADPFLFRPGDAVRFVRIPPDEFDRAR
jgi:KipI family sensor histidine kinase inhibitor